MPHTQVPDSVLLAQAVASYTRAGFSVVSLTDTQAVVRKLPPLNLLLNLLLAVLTGGVWLIVMLVRYSSRERRAKQVVLTVSGGQVIAI